MVKIVELLGSAELWRGVEREGGQLRDDEVSAGSSDGRTCGCSLVYVPLKAFNNGRLEHRRDPAKFDSAD